MHMTSIFATAGPIAESERLILLDSLAIMLAIVVPTLLAIIGFAWWFRAGNSRAVHLPKWAYSGQVELLVWSVPALVVMFLGGIAWIGSHEVDPAKPLASKVKPLEVEVVSLDWRWLFIYPELHIASINRLVAPVDVPIHARITSASVMNVFFIPRIASEIYGMNGMATQLNFEADKAGSYPGLSAHFSGDGFADMRFSFDAVPQAQFDAWIKRAQASGVKLDDAAYRKLLPQSHDTAAYTYRDVRPGLFDAIVMQQLPPGAGPTTGAGDAR
jgi:cytochrome o ubiquinol oxidase subunit 2